MRSFTLLLLTLGGALSCARDVEPIGGPLRGRPPATGRLPDGGDPFERDATAVNPGGDATFLDGAISTASERYGYLRAGIYQGQYDISFATAYFRETATRDDPLCAALVVGRFVVQTCPVGAQPAEEMDPRYPHAGDLSAELGGSRNFLVREEPSGRYDVFYSMEPTAGLPGTVARFRASGADVPAFNDGVQFSRGLRSLVINDESPVLDPARPFIVRWSTSETDLSVGVDLIQRDPQYVRIAIDVAADESEIVIPPSRLALFRSGASIDAYVGPSREKNVDVGGWPLSFVAQGPTQTLTLSVR